MAKGRSKGDAPDEIDILVGRRLRELRTLAGLSQTQIGESAGLSFQQIQKYERGVNRISASKLYSLAAFLGTPVSHFFIGIEASDHQIGNDDALNSEISDPNLRSREALTLTRNLMRIKDSDTQIALKNIIHACASE